MSFWQRVKRVSIWDDDAIPELEMKYAPLKRRMFPAIDLVLVAMGLTGAAFGVPSVEEVFGRATATAGTLAFAALGFLALMGISFPKLWALEAVAKSLLIGSSTVYALSLLFVVTTKFDPNRLYLLGWVIIGAILMSFRLAMLRYERVNRHAETAIRKLVEDEEGRDL